MSTKGVDMARRRRYADPVAARQRRILAQGIGLTLLLGAAVFTVFMAVTSG
jgi:hypothetical protein